MPDLATLRDLLERVENATGPDREIDAEIMFDLFAKPVGQREDGGPSGYLWPEDSPSWSFGMRFPGKDRDWLRGARRRIDGETLAIDRDGALVLMNALRIPPLTASIDAAIDLVHRLLPGWWVSAGLCSLTGHASLGPDYNGPHRERLMREFPPELFEGGFDADFAPGDGWHRTCYAILWAMLRALIAQAETAPAQEDR